MGRLSFLFPFVFLLPSFSAGQARTGGEPMDSSTQVVRLTLVIVLASTNDHQINPRLRTLAAEVQKRDASFTGFRIHETRVQSIPIGGRHTFELPEDQQATVGVCWGEDRSSPDRRAEVKIRLPGLDEVTYACVCHKFFPIMTPYKLKSGETILVAVQAKPCSGP